MAAAAAANAAGGMVKVPGNAQQGPNGINLPNQSWANAGYQFYGMMMPGAGKSELEKYMQQVGCVNDESYLIGSTVFSFFILFMQ